jgi:Lrp/AsnC family transcriptional regulator for asnA, asnC and gidA
MKQLFTDGVFIFWHYFASKATKMRNLGHYWRKCTKNINEISTFTSMDEKMFRSLDKLDKIILKSLLIDGRRNFTDIAKENNTTINVVWKRFQELEKKGIIVGATIQYNYQSFGYNGLASILLNVESQKINQVVENIRKNQQILVNRLYGSAYNIWCLAILRTLRDLEVAKVAIRQQNPINETKTFLWIDVRNTPENIIAIDENTNFQAEEKLLKDTFNQENSLTIDETDFKIVEKLSENGRASFRSIGKEIGISTDTVARRYEKLTKNNFIKVCIQVDPKQLGYQIILVTNILLSNQDEMRPAADAISRIPGVTYIVKTSGDYDLNVSAMVKDYNDFVGILEKIEEIPHIRRIETTLRQAPTKWPGPKQYMTTF